MYEDLKDAVCSANLALAEHGLSPLTWGNVSGIDRAAGIIAIKPSGVEYKALKPRDIVIVSLEDGKAASGGMHPSSDTPTHLELYRRFTEIGGVAHTHSRWATVFAQTEKNIPLIGTTHADCFYGEIPCVRPPTPEEISGDYERAAGTAIAEAFAGRDPLAVPAALLPRHGPFIWGINPIEAVKNAITLEEVAFMAWHCLIADPKISPLRRDIAEKHYRRKHGGSAYYGQR